MPQPRLRRDQFFNSDAQAHRNRAVRILDTQLDAAFLPYDNFRYHASSLIYPIFHASKILVSSARILYGTLLFVGAIIDKPLERMPEILKGIFSEAITILAHAINLVASIASLVTRNLSTIFNCGYARSSIERTDTETPTSFVDYEYGSTNLLEANIYNNTTALRS